MTKIFARSFSFPIIAMFEMPIFYNAKIPANKVVYLGHLNAQIINKARGDLPAGPLTPLLDQAIAGASTGTFKIKYEGKYDQDIEVIKQEYPIFKPIDIVNMSPPMAN